MNVIYYEGNNTKPTHIKARAFICSPKASIHFFLHYQYLFSYFAFKYI